MVSLLLVLVGLVSVLSEPASSCGEKEFTSKDGFCCPMCQKGLHVSRECTEDLGTKCQPCPEGTFTDKPNGLKNCASCSLCAGHGLFTRQNCTSTSDTLCGVLDGYFCLTPENSGCSLAQKHSRCDPGQKTKHPGSSTADTVCEDCPPGSFSVDGLNCTQWTECSEFERREREGSSVSDVVCSSATRNHNAIYFSFALCLLLTLLIVIKCSIHSRTKADREKQKEKSRRTRADGQKQTEKSRRSRADGLEQTVVHEAHEPQNL